jgi:uncharacterized protein (TIGR00255 family)
MIKSMTAFSRAEITKEGLTIRIEIRAYNSRHLDAALHMPHEYLFLEDKIKRSIAARITRGRIAVNIEIRNDPGETSALEIDEFRAAAYHDMLCRLKEKFNINDEISLDLLLNSGDIIKPAEIDEDMETRWQVIKRCLQQAIDDLDNMRKREGIVLAEDLRNRLDYLAENKEQIEKTSVNLLSHYQNRLKERISALTKGIVEIDPERIAQEAAFLADKSDISEEIVRVASHIEQFKEIMDTEEPAGRKLNFLLQEFNREFNTMGSKTGNTDISYLVVDAKAEIEKMREQIQNVE